MLIGNSGLVVGDLQALLPCRVVCGDIELSYSATIEIERLEKVTVLYDGSALLALSAEGAEALETKSL